MINRLMTDDFSPPNTACPPAWLRFQVTIHGAPSAARLGSPCQLTLDRDEQTPRELPPSPLEVTPLELTAEQRATPLAVSFEQLAQQLESWPRLFFEPDGSFVWVGQADNGRRWQLEGYLYDHAGRLQFIELKGECPRAAVEQMLRACGWPAEPLMFQLPRRAIFLAESDFWRWAAC